MHVSITSFNGVSNVGLFAFANDKFVLLGKEVPESHDAELKEVFKVPIHRITVAGTSLIGVFVNGNNDKIMVPGIIFDEEKEALEKLGIDYEVLKTKHTCLGNNIIIDEKNALINPEFSDAELKEIENLMSVKAKKTAIADVHAIGSLFVLNKARKKALVSNEIDLEELKMLQDTFNVEISAGSVNMGSPYVRSGIIANKNGFIIGNTSGGPEITNADESLGFLEDE